MPKITRLEQVYGYEAVTGSGPGSLFEILEKLIDKVNDIIDHINEKENGNQSTG